MKWFRTLRVKQGCEDEEAVITRLLIEAGGVFCPRGVARYLIKNGVCMKGWLYD